MLKRTLCWGFIGISLGWQMTNAALNAGASTASGKGVGSLSPAQQQPQQDAATAERDAALSEIKRKIAGSEDEPAEKVFKNIEILKGKKASRLPGMMSALTGLLGVNCTYCHIKDKWDSEEK